MTKKNESFRPFGIENLTEIPDAEKLAVNGGRRRPRGVPGVSGGGSPGSGGGGGTVTPGGPPSVGGGAVSTMAFSLPTPVFPTGDTF